MRKEKKLTLRLRPGEDDDLLIWLDELRLPHGKKGETIKDTLRRGLRSAETPSVTKLDAGNLLADIRQVVEATLVSALANISLEASSPMESAEEDEKIGVCLDQLGESLLFELDDDRDEGWGKTTAKTGKNPLENW